MDKIYKVYRGVLEGYSKRWKVEEIEIDGIDVFYDKSIAIAESEKRNNEIDMYNKNNCTVCKFGKEEKSHYRTIYKFNKFGEAIATYYFGRDKNESFKCLDFERKDEN